MNRNEMDPSKWVDDHADYLYAYAITRVNKKETVQDLVQETFLSALKAKDNFQYKSKIQTWLTSILRNKIFDHYRNSKKMDIKLSGDDDFNEKLFEPGGFGMVWVDKTNEEWDFDQITEKKSSFQNMLENCLDRLSEFQQSVFKLKNYDGLDSEEICKVLDITSSNYWVITHRSKLKLRNCVQTNWFNKAI